ncbi:MAG: hypothetical protein JRF30_08375 [Deltaproteobacteria bacterium]|nr:hypothetical protein [Deltaproteobacteria bacterium]MBW1796349.1 hypothetical protein [Deltaproteobacteria bacterium]MBW2330928.1 hypothetical protein [Deltaproteobacteria bacterium]
MLLCSCGIINLPHILTYLKLSGINLGLLLNFNVTIMRDGIVRIVNELKDKTSAPFTPLR